jgi:uncharacterized membrane protein
MIPILASIGLLAGTLIYFTFSPKPGPGKPQCPEVLLKALGEDESALIRALLLNGGSLSQTALTRITGLQKVKVFRILERLKSRGLVEKIPAGKTNTITLTKEMRAFIPEK